MQKSWYLSQKIGVICDVQRYTRAKYCRYYLLTVKKELSKRVLSISTEHIAILIQRYAVNTSAANQQCVLYRTSSIFKVGFYDLLCHLATTRCPPGVQEIAAQYMYIHRGCGGKLFVECTFWLVKAEPLIRSRVALRIYVQPIRILFLILMNVLEVKLRIAATESMTFADIELCIENIVHKTACFT